MRCSPVVIKKFYSCVREKQSDQKRKRAKQRTFKANNPVFVLSFSSGPTWLPGTIKECKGVVFFKVQLEDNGIIRRHFDHIRHRTVDVPPTLSRDFRVTLNFLTFHRLPINQVLMLHSFNLSN